MIKTQFHSKLIFIVISILLISAFSPAHILSDHSSGMAPPDEDNNTGGNGTGYFNQTWYIDASDDLAYANQSLILSGDLIINNSGRLVLSNFTLAINSSFNGQFRIIVEPGGILEIHSNSTISILS